MSRHRGRWLILTQDNQMYFQPSTVVLWSDRNLTVTVLFVYFRTVPSFIEVFRLLGSPLKEVCSTVIGTLNDCFNSSFNSYSPVLHCITSVSEVPSCSVLGDQVRFVSLPFIVKENLQFSFRSDWHFRVLRYTTPPRSVPKSLLIPPNFGSE